MPIASWMARLWWRFTALLALIGAAALLAGGALTAKTLGNAERTAFTARFTLAAEHAAQAAENALALGVPLETSTALAGLLTREAAALEPALQRFQLETIHGRRLLAAEVAPAVALATPAATALVSVPIRNDLGQTVGWVRLSYDDGDLRTAEQALRRSIWQAAWPALLFMLATLGLLCAVLVHRLRRGRPALRLFGGERALLAGATALTLGVALAAVGWQANEAGQELIAPAQQAQAEALARSSAALIERAVAVGVPIGAIAGLPQHTAELRQRSPQVAALALLAPDGTLLGGSPIAAGLGTVGVPVRDAGGALVARVVLGLDTQVLTRALQARLVDVAFLGAICLLLALEWVSLGLGARGARALAVSEAWRRRHGAARRPAQAWRPSSATAVRPALFLFMLAEELTRPFLPTWARALAPTGWGLSPDAWASVPMVLFLAAVALLQWPLAAWSQRAGRRRGLVLGALLGAFGLAGAAVLPGYVALIGVRLVGALGFALVFVSAQGAVIDGSSSQDRARSLGQFVRTILVAGLCGPPLGGLAADQWGVPAAFGLAAAVCALAALAAWVQMRRAHCGSSAPAPAAGAGPSATRGALLQRSGLLPLLLGCALPAKLLLTALCFYLLPMHLQDAGYDNAVIGRLQTLYPLMMVLLVPLAARAADRWQRRSAFVALGGLLAGASACLAWPAGSAPLALAGVLLGLGVGQALSITPQSALVADLARRQAGAHEAAVLGLFRLTERSGSALGPALGAGLLPLLGFGPALALIGTVVMLGSLAYGWSARGGRGDRRLPQP